MSLDPPDFGAFRSDAHRMLDEILDDLVMLRQKPLWRDPAPAYTALDEPMPRAGGALGELNAFVASNIMPYASGNRHPGFMGWVQGAGTPYGLIGDMVASGLNMNVGGRHHVGVAIERQVSQWMREAMGYPQTAHGLMTTGASQANFIAVLIARHKVLKKDRKTGVASSNLVGYASTEVHGCVTRAFEMAGLGADALRKIEVDRNFKINIDCLARALKSDRQKGYTPFMIVGSAGTVNTGAIDDLDALANLADDNAIHYHIDGALGAGAMLSRSLKTKFKGLERSHSLAFDFHKWMHAPYDAGFLLTHDAAEQYDAFASDAAYLTRAQSGLAAGDDWPCDYGPDLSRGARALKVWYTIKSLGADALAEAMERNCELAHYLSTRVDQTKELERLAPCALNIVVFRYRHPDADRVNRMIIEALHKDARVAPSLTLIDGQAAIRAAIVNHRTMAWDIESLIQGVLSFGGQL